MPDRTILEAAPHRRATAPSRRRSLPPARTALAVLLLAMATGQLSDVGGFARILGTYQVLPHGLLTPAAWMAAGTETLAGVLLLGGRHNGGCWALVVALAWTVLSLQAFARGLALDNCGCFGVHLGQRLRWWVLVEDAEFVALAAYVRARFGQRASGPETAR